MTDHYQTLGADRGATQEEIKQAWRKMSAKHHPDREGGDPEEMAKVNTAYECLSDPDRRAEYDRTGNDVKPGSVEQEARDALLQLFKIAIEGGDDIIRQVSQMLETNKKNMRAQQNEAFTRRSRLAKKSGKVRAKAGMNLYQVIIDQEIAALDSKLDRMARGTEVFDMATTMLQNYEQDEVEPAPQAVHSLYFNFNDSPTWRP